MSVQVIHDDAWDWEILVVNGKPIGENHSLSIHDWERAFDELGISFEVVEVDDIEKSEYYQQ